MKAPLLDRGADMGVHRFHVVLPAERATEGDTIETDRGTFRVTKVGRSFDQGGVQVAYYYLAVDAEQIGAPRHLTEEIKAIRAERAERSAAAGRAYWEAMTPAQKRSLQKRMSASAKQRWEALGPDGRAAHMKRMRAGRKKKAR